MKKFNVFVLVVAVAISLFCITSCSEDPTQSMDDVAYEGAESYAGPLVGSWIAEDVSDNLVETTTFGSNGTVLFDSRNSDDADDWFTEKGVFVVKDNILAITYRVYEDSEGVDEDEYSEYYYIVSTENGELDMWYLFGEDMTLDEALEFSAEYAEEHGTREVFKKK